MTDRLDELVNALEGRAGPDTSNNESLVPTGQRPCPICGKHMQVESMHGVQIDACVEHGVWLDTCELLTVVGRVRAKAGAAKVEAVRRARRDGRVSGALLGVWSLLLD